MQPDTTTSDETSVPADLLQRIRAGDQEAFAELVRAHQSFAYALAMRYLRVHAEAEDVVQEAFLRVWRNIGGYDPAVKFSTWLYAIVTRLSIDRTRHRRRWSLILVRRDDAPEPATGSSLTDDIHRAGLVRSVHRLVKRLPRVQRMVFTLRDLQDLSVEEVAAITGMTASTIKANLCHARRRLRAWLTAEGLEEGGNE